MTTNGFSTISFPSMSQQVTNELRKAIIENRMKAGAQITEISLSTELGVSRTVVREAMTALVADGLLQRVSSHLTRVAYYTDTDVREIYDLRACLETGAVNLMEDPVMLVPRLRRLNDDARHLAESDDFDSYTFVSQDKDFHTTIIEACGNRRLIDAWNRIIGPMEVLMHRYVIYVMQRTPGHKIPYDHSDIIRAFESGDREWIRSAVLEHNKVMKRIILEELVSSDGDDLQTGEPKSGLGNLKLLRQA